MGFFQSLFVRPKLIWTKRSPLQTVCIYEKGPIRYMRFASESWQGALDTRNKERILFPYQRFFLAYRAWLPEIRSFLALGVGTGTSIRTIRHRHPDARICGVDVDSVVLQAAVTFFDCPSDENTKLCAMHGRAFLESSRDRYDLIFLDAYDSYSIPKSMRSVECMQQARNLLEENGLLIVNVIGRISGPESGFFRSFYKTIREVFSEVWVLPVTRWTRMEQNILLIARRSVGTQMHPDSKGDKELEKLLRRLYLRTIPTSDVPVCRDTE